MPGGLSSFIGNPLNDGTWQYEWVNGRRLARMYSVDTDASFVYNENGLRVQKTVNGVVTKYTLHGKNVVHMTQGSNELHFFYDAQNKPAIAVYNGVPYSYVKNLQGDFVALLDSTGAVVVKYVYDAWGRPISKTGNMAGTLGTVQPFRYRGYVYDEENGSYYLRSRYYSPSMCRFVNADILLEGNLYTYCKENPVVYSDESGYAAVCCFDENGGITSWIQHAMTGGVGGDSNGGMTANVYLMLPPEKTIPYASLVLRAHIAVASGNIISKGSSFLGAAFAKSAIEYNNCKLTATYMKAIWTVGGYTLDTVLQNVVNNFFSVESEKVNEYRLAAEVVNTLSDELDSPVEEITYVRNVCLTIVDKNPTYVDLVQKAFRFLKNKIKLP